MKTYQSAFLSLLFLATLAGCGNEQFGTGGQSSNSTANPLTSFSFEVNTSFTLIKPKVDVLYVVDDSYSGAAFSNSLRDSIISTVNRLSGEFDYRIVGTKLISTSLSDYNVMTNSSDVYGIDSSKVISNPGAFGFFNTAQGGGYEQGITRAYNFLNAHKGTLFRRESHLIVVLVSNGLDADIEYVETAYGNFEIKPRSDATTKMNNFQTNLTSIKTFLASQQIRFITTTAHSKCNSSYFPSLNSYVAMSRRMYMASGATDQANDSSPDAYDLCSNGVESIFTSINNAIKQVLIPHEYRYLPITFADQNSSTVSFDDMQVTKVSPGGGRTTLVRGTHWNLNDRGSVMQVNTRVLPSAGEPVNGRYFVEMLGSNLRYPDSLLITSVSRTESYNFVVFPQRPIMPGAKVFVNGSEIPASALGSSVSAFKTDNIKYSPSNTPPVIKSGYFLEITNPQYFYKSGDNVSTQFTPAPI